MRSKETIQQELTETRTRLSAYLAREADMLSKDGVQLYTIGSRNLQRYQTSLASVQDMIAKLQKRVRELEAELAGGSARRAVGVVPRDWWGPHTAAYKYNGSMDARAIFDVNIRMLEHITNSFQKDHGTEIDSPMTPQDKDSVLNFEKEKLDTLLGIGALIGTPSVEFVESANPTSNMLNGDFVWDFSVTNTPPFKSGTARVCYTDEGFQSFFATE